MGERTFKDIAELLEAKAEHFSFDLAEDRPAPVSPADIN